VLEWFRCRHILRGKYITIVAPPNEWNMIMQIYAFGYTVLFWILEIINSHNLLVGIEDLNA